MTKQYPIISLPNGYLYMVEHEAEIEDGGWCFEIHENYEDPRPKFKDKDDPTMAWWLRQLNMSYRKKEYKPIGLEFRRIIDGSCIKVIASSDPFLTDIPQLPEIEEKKEDIRKKAHHTTFHNREIRNSYERNGYEAGWYNGYKAALKDGKKYTEADMLKAIQYGKTIHPDDNLLYGKEYTQFIVSLRSLPIAIETEVKLKDTLQEYLPKVDQNNKIIGTYVYE